MKVWATHLHLLKPFQGCFLCLLSKNYSWSRPHLPYPVAVVWTRKCFKASPPYILPAVCHLTLRSRKLVFAVPPISVQPLRSSLLLFCCIYFLISLCFCMLEAKKKDPDASVWSIVTANIVTWFIFVTLEIAHFILPYTCFQLWCIAKCFGKSFGERP